MVEATIARDVMPPDFLAAPDEEFAPTESFGSIVVAGLLVAAVVFINEATFRINDPERFSVDWQVLLRLAVCAACGLYALCHLSTAVRALDRFPGLWLTAFGAWALITVPFAVNVPYAAACCGSLWCVILFAPVALRHLGLRRLLIVVLASLAAFAIASWIAYYAVPAVGQTEDMNPDGEILIRLGGLSSANGLGRQMSVMTMAILFLGSQRMLRWRVMLPWLALALATMVFSDSRTAMIATAAVAALFFIRKLGSGAVTAKSWSLLALGGALVAGLMIAGSETHTLRTFSRSGEVEELYNLTGRIDIWQHAIDKISEAPLLGYGWGCARFPMGQFDDMILGHAHNLILNTTLNSGVVGGLLLVTMFLTLMTGLLRSPSIFPDSVLVLVFVLGITDSPMLNPVPDVVTLLWFMAILWRSAGESPPILAREAVCESM